MHWSLTEMVFAVTAVLMVGWVLILFCKAITHAVADVWFAARERHTKRIIALSKEDK